MMTVCSSVLAFGGMPFNLWLYGNYWQGDNSFVIPFTNIMISLVFITVPVIVGMTVRHFHKRAAEMTTRVSIACCRPIFRSSQKRSRSGLPYSTQVQIIKQITYTSPDKRSPIMLVTLFDGIQGFLFQYTEMSNGATCNLSNISFVSLQTTNRYRV